MEIGGLVIAAVFVALLGTVPTLVARRTAIVQSREKDRFSPTLRMIDTNASEWEECGGASAPLLAPASMVSGETMQATRAAHQRPTIDRRNNQTVRDIARLRARRAARLAAEAAAGRRRMVMSALFALATIITAIVVTVNSWSWAWIAIPTAALVISLATSRLAARRSEREAQRESEQLASLRSNMRGGTRRIRAAAPAARLPQESIEEEHVVARVVGLDDTDPDEAPRTPLRVVASTHTGPVPSLVFNTNVPEDLVEAPATPQRAWTVAPIPAPTYATRARITGRTVHADTDLRGIPRVTAAIPARPIAATPQKDARSTLEVVADSAVALDLDAVLDARRAQ